MDPFADDACCLFKIGAKQSRITLKSNSKVEKKKNTGSKTKIILLTLASLLLWIILGPLFLIPFIPYMAYQKLIKHSG